MKKIFLTFIVMMLAISFKASALDLARSFYVGSGAVGWEPEPFSAVMSFAPNGKAVIFLGGSASPINLEYTQEDLESGFVLMMFEQGRSAGFLVPIGNGFGLMGNVKISGKELKLKLFRGTSTWDNDKYSDQQLLDMINNVKRYICLVNLEVQGTEYCLETDISFDNGHFKMTQDNPYLYKYLGVSEGSYDVTGGKLNFIFSQNYQWHGDIGSDGRFISVPVGKVNNGAKAKIYILM